MAGQANDRYHDPRAALFNALRHPVRLAILTILQQGEACVCHLEAVLKRRQAYVSQQLGVLREAGLIEDRREGLNVYYRLRTPELTALLERATAVVGNGARPSFPVAVAGCGCPRCSPRRGAEVTASGMG